MICAKCERRLYVGERKLVINAVAPSRERGLKFGVLRMIKKDPGVAPSRERGLKCAREVDFVTRFESLLRGSVD